MLHCPNEYDYWFASDHKDEIIKRFSGLCLQITGEPILIWETNQESLKEFVTQKSDKKKGVTKMPRKEAAVNYSEIEQSMHGACDTETIYADPREESKEKVRYEDFDIVSNLGKGAIGKVVLARKRNTGKMYAIKSLRKDRVLETDQVEYITTEKRIMENIHNPFLVKLVW